MPELARAERTAPALSVRGLTYRYPNAREDALREVSLSLAAGEFAVLAGRSASGKSTLLRAACGLVPHFHGGEIDGEVTVAGVDAVAAGPGSLAAEAGFVAQDPETQVVSTTVRSEVELPLELRGEAPPARARAVEEVALALGIPHLLERAVDSLSGGELQRVALAAALVTRPSLVLLDEPTSQLDPVAGDELIWMLRRLNEEWGVAVLLAEHRLERCLAAADRVIAMDDGAVAFDGPPGRFLDWALTADPVLTTPSARLFAAAGLRPSPVGVGDGRRRLSEEHPGAIGPGRGPDASWHAARGDRPPAGPALEARGGRAPAGPVLEARGLWVERERDDGPRDVLRAIDLAVGAGERIALMGRNGAGKSTLLRAAAGLHDPVRGSVRVPRGIALLTQNPGDFLVRERVADELPGAAGRAALEMVGLGGLAESDPSDLSGGERQRLALAIALAGRTEGAEMPGLVALDEPTRGMDRERRDDLVSLAAGLAGRGAGIVIATHDAEFAAEFATRVVLLGDGVLIADGDPAEVLSGGWHFSTEVARLLGMPGVITAEHGLAALEDLTG